MKKKQNVNYRKFYFGFFIMILLPSIFSKIYGQNVEIQGQLKVTDLNLNDTAAYVLIQNQDSTFGKRTVSSLLEVQGTAPGQIKYWNGSEWVLLPIGETGQILTVSDSLIPEWKTPQKIGKPYIIIQGDINNEEAAQRIEEDFGNSTQFVWVKNTKSLTFLDLSMVTSLIELRIVNNLHLENVELDSLEDVVDVIEVINNTELIQFSINQLTQFKGSIFRISQNSSLLEVTMNNYFSNRCDLEISGNSSLTTLSLPSLSNNYEDLYIGHNNSLNLLLFPVLSVNNSVIYIQNNAILQTISMPSLQESFETYINFNGSLNLIQLPVLNNVSNKMEFNQNGSISSIVLPDLIELNGTIKFFSNNNLLNVSFPNLENCSGTIDFQSNAALTGFELPSLLMSPGQINFQDNVNLTSIQFPLVVEMGGFYISPSQNLNQISFPLLEMCSGMTLSYLNSLTAINFPELRNTGGMVIRYNTMLNSISFPSLDSTQNNLNISNNNLLNNINISNLSYVGGNLNININPALQSLNFPQLISIGGRFNGSSNYNLTSVTFPSLTTYAGIDFSVISNELSSNVINDLLARFVALGNTPLQNIYLNSQDPPAPPTGQGIIDKNTLIAAGKTVITD